MKRLLLAAILAFSSFAANAAAPPYRLSLFDLMDAHYGVGSWTFYTGQGTGTDIGPALQDGITAIQAISSGNKTGIIELGPYSWAMKFAPSDFAGISVEGVTSSRSIVVYQNAAGVAFGFKLGPGGGLKHIGLLLDSGLGDTNSYAVFLYGNNIYQPDQMEFDDLYITAVGGLSYWFDDVHLDGQNRTSPIGIRVGHWTNIQTFNARNVSIYLGSAIQQTFVNVGCYTGKGYYAGQMLIQGTPSVPSVNNTIIGSACVVVNGANVSGTAVFGN